jgi:hypothetical protein
MWEFIVYINQYKSVRWCELFCNIIVHIRLIQGSWSHTFRRSLDNLKVWCISDNLLYRPRVMRRRSVNLILLNYFEFHCTVHRAIEMCFIFLYDSCFVLVFFLLTCTELRMSWACRDMQFLM